MSYKIFEKIYYSLMLLDLFTKKYNQGFFNQKYRSSKNPWSPMGLFLMFCRSTADDTLDEWDRLATDKKVH